jgi:hypothetical protein
MTPGERIAELEAVVQQREQIATLLERVHDLEACLAKDSHNSGKRPSSDGLARKTKNLRRTSGKKPGGTCACSKSSKRSPAASAQTTAPTRSLACVATSPPSENKAWHCWLPSRRLSPVAHSIQPLPDLPRCAGNHDPLLLQCMD